VLVQFIDTLHTGEQLRQELRLHSSRVRKYIVLHDTTLCAYKVSIYKLQV
jgi:hypothetical protein